ncbi:hypothetical protein B0H14DRAFT_3493979 [Mycena olivaceomarginata]|nr:hypothetical protein B0H14DRAFT_3493979 [Mycena olivaceomarginata]
MRCAALGNHVVFDLPILTQQKEASGVAALTTLCLIVLTSVAPADASTNLSSYLAYSPAAYLLFPRPLRHPLLPHHLRPAMDLPPWAFHGADLLLQILRPVLHATAGRRTVQHIQLRALIGGWT